MLKSIIACGLATMALAGCSAASATPADPSNDVHCFALATAFRAHAQSIGAPADAQRATAAIETWYAPGFDAAVATRGRSSVLSEGEALAAAMDRDPAAAHAALVACTDRAAADPGFDAFAARFPRR
jgi:hypothetical protein